MSNEESTYETVYTGSEVNIQYLQSILKKASIHSIVKNNFESGLRAGFGGGLPGQVQLLVERSHLEEAQKIVEATFSSENE
ncbi:putative signal transducing protein [Mesonia maritima]|uniref:DUF2007 domain-containing protein n=1 Tax=Mesonia maritima TaxID=1793873 RepID=A0ABU1K442_9FLAO|nr:DUF2007 domain-containing protein [Mesonia maritima]MDR6300389.1 hypothetical protein [Mesonia maritima]